FGRSETAALVAVVAAWGLGAAAWLNEVDSAASETPADSISFEDRFVPMSGADSIHAKPALQPLDHSALAVFEGKPPDARGLLAQQLLFSDWRSAFAEAKPTSTIDSSTSTTDIPLPRSRPAAADVQVAAAVVDSGPRPDDRSMLQKLSDYLPGKIR